MSACDSRYYCVYIIFYWDGGIMSACESRYYCVYIIFYWDGCIMSACGTPVDNFKKHNSIKILFHLDMSICVGVHLKISLNPDSYFDCPFSSQSFFYDSVWMCLHLYKKKFKLHIQASTTLLHTYKWTWIFQITNSIQFKVYWQNIGNHLHLAINIYMYTWDKALKRKHTKLWKNEEKNTNKQNTKIQYKRTPNTHNCE